MFTLIIPHDDFAFLMALVARVEQAYDEQKIDADGKVDVPFDEGDVTVLSKIASDLSQQADGQS